MNYKELQQFSKVMHNSISHDDFVEAAKLHEYSADYVDTIWGRWCNNSLAFISSHDMGEDIFHMIQSKMQSDNILTK